MSNLYRDILYLIFEQLQEYKKTLYSCLLVNKTWCEIIIPILWKNPWIPLKVKNEMLLLNVIFSHLSNVSRNKIGDLKLLTNSYQKPSFNYISYCRFLNLDKIKLIINYNIYEVSKRSIVQEEILNLFINENMKFTHFFIHNNFNQYLHFINGAERCLSEIEFLSCSTDINDNILIKLIETCKSIKILNLYIKNENDNYGIVKLIEAQKKLYNISLTRHRNNNEEFCKILENSLIKHANTIQYCKINGRPSTNFLPFFVNLKVLELSHNARITASWNFLKNIPFPFLQILKSNGIPIEALTSLIKNTNGSLIEIKIDLDYIRHDEISNKKLIQAIYQNCPNIKYLKLLIRNCNLLELEKLLINCQYLDRLYIIVSSHTLDRTFYWDRLFEILTKSSPTRLFKFKFNSYKLPTLESFKLFFDNWKGRHPMFLQLISNEVVTAYFETLKRYKEEGIVKKFGYDYWWDQRSDDFEWI
jgi:hypothetical protein